MALVATLARFKSWIRYTGSSTVDDDNLTLALGSATAWLEWRIGGPLEVTSFTERYRCNGWSIVPNKRPLATVASITPDLGTVLDSSWYVADTTTNQVRFYYGVRPHWGTLVYGAGLTTVPYNYTNAGLELARHLWLTQNGSSGRGRADDDIPVPMGFAVPRRVDELLMTTRIGGFA